jgi:magnesium-transporting ATPase (P-type)
LTPAFWADLVVYGLIMAACLLGSFSIVLFGFYGGQIGNDCNIKYSDSCDAAFRARSTCYTVMMWIFLLFAWQLIDSYRSLFDGILRDPIAWSHRLIDNKPLFWSVVVGFVTVFPTLYIPGLNHDAFLHTGIGKEWGIVFGMTLFFFISCEIWKWIKRRYVLQRRLVKQGEEIDQMDVESLDGRLDQGV